MRFLFACVFVASFRSKFLIQNYFSSIFHGEKTRFVQIGERSRTAVRFAEAVLFGSYSLPHCLPVKNRSVVVARNTLPARSTVEGNSGCEGLQG